MRENIYKIRYSNHVFLKQEIYFSAIFGGKCRFVERKPARWAENKAIR